MITTNLHKFFQPFGPVHVHVVITSDLMSSILTSEDQERHLLVKVIDRILYKLDDLVRPYVHKVRHHFV